MGFEYGPSCITDMRHAAVWLQGDSLYIFYSRVYDTPEAIYITEVDLTPHWKQWKCKHGKLLMRPKYDYEGVNLPIMQSSPGVAYSEVHELRDPAVYEEDGHMN